MSERGPFRFSAVAFAVAVVTVGVGTAAGLALVPTVGAYVGTLAGGFVAGLALEERPVLESGVAAVVAGLGVLVAGTLVGNGVVDAVLALGSIDPVTLLVSVVLSFAVGAFGGHFGDDLRDGLTEPIEAPAAGRTTLGSAGPPPTEPADVERAEAERADDQPVRPEEAAQPAESESADVELERN